MENKNSNKLNPPYIPWETFKGFFKTLKETHVPDRIDNSMMPTTMSGFNKAGITTALKFFSLIDANGDTTDNLKAITSAYETDGWPGAIKEILIPAYRNIIGDLKLNAATRNQLDEKFADTSSVQMKDRFIRFYIPMLKEAGEQVSHYLTLRQNRPARNGPKKIAKKQLKVPPGSDGGLGGGQPQKDETPSGMFDMPIPIASAEKCFVRVPRDITTEQVTLITAAVAFITAMAKQNEENK